jgi:hypothetical protein
MKVVKVSKRLYHMLDHMMYWCKQNVGVGGYLTYDNQLWRIETNFGDSEFLFVDDEDAVAFKLKFGRHDSSST